MERKTIIFILIVIMAFLLGLFLSNMVFTGKTITEDEQKNLEEYTWTKAICNSKNECIDVLITCENNQVKKIEPISKLMKIENLDYNSGELC